MAIQMKSEHPRSSDRRKWAPLSLAPGGLTWSYASLLTGKVSESVCVCEQRDRTYSRDSLTALCHPDRCNPSAPMRRWLQKRPGERKKERKRLNRLHRAYRTDNHTWNITNVNCPPILGHDAYPKMLNLKRGTVLAIITPLKHIYNICITCNENNVYCNEKLLSLIILPL